MSTNIVVNPALGEEEAPEQEVSAGRSTSKRAGDSLTSLIIAHGLLIILAIFFILPLVLALAASLKPQFEVFSQPPTLVGSKIMWSNYIEAFTSFPVIKYFINSLFVSISGTLVVIAISCLAGYAFGRLRWKGRDVVFIAFLATLMIPQEVLVVPMFFLMQLFDWTNSFEGMIFPFAFGAFGTFLMRQFFRTIPYELDEAAKIDGAGSFTIFWRVVLPMAKSSIAVLAVFTFLGFWNSYLWPLIVVTDYDAYGTIPIGLAAFSTERGTRWDLQMAATIMSMIPTTLLVIGLSKHLMKGIATVSGMGGR